MPAFEWVHVQLHQQKGMISLSPPTICNSALLCATPSKNCPLSRLSIRATAPRDKSSLSGTACPRNARMKPSAGHCAITAITAAICLTSSWVPVTPSPRN
ncbi:hypothetical protein DM065_35985 [Klebsiella pneumoniae]|nr:hypothetical protein DM065_35985 [Klebsiella pneumoniae]